MIREIKAKSLLRKHKKIDSWFVARYGMNLYRGCLHNCAYCDGRAEGYYVEGEFGKDIDVKINAPELLQKELDPKRKRIPFKKGFIMIGGGVGDSYNVLDKKYELSRKILNIVSDYDFPVHVLTKSTLVKRDIDILHAINQKSKAIISFSFSGVDDNICKIFEPGVPPATERLETISFFKKEGFPVGVFMMPVIPFITDLPDQMENSIRKFKEAGVDFIIFGGMTLKEGRQQDYFYKVLKENYPDLLHQYEMIYKGDKWGGASHQYYESINKLFLELACKYQISKRIPAKLYNQVIDQNDVVAVILDQMDYILKQKGQKSPYGYAAYSVSQLKEPITEHLNKLQNLSGVGPVTEKIILEILETGTSGCYEKLLIT
ncbi:MAG: radical SAM protein [Bacteroidales bacterium]|nr:radical SAM protein [Bacteroidales bacterium]